MAEEKKAKAQVQPHQLKGERVRICGKWQKKGYKPSKDEEAAYKRQQEILAAGKKRVEKIGKAAAAAK